MISAKGGRPPPPVPPRPSKQVVAEALAKNRPPKPISHVSKLIDRTEKSFGNYVNHQVIKKREDLLNAKNATNNKNPGLVAWGGTVIYRSPSFIRDEEKKKLEDAERQEKGTINIENKSLNDEPSKICNIDASKLPKPKAGSPTSKLDNIRRFDSINNSFEKTEDDIVKNNMNNMNNIVKCPSVKDIIKSLHEEKVENNSKIKNNSYTGVAPDQTFIKGNEVNSIRINNIQKEININSVNCDNYDLKPKVMNESSTNFKASTNLQDFFKSNADSSVSETSLNMSNGNLDHYKEIVETKSLSEPEIIISNNALNNAEPNNKDIQVKSSVTKVAIAPSSDTQISIPPVEETRVVIGSGSTTSATRILANGVPTTTTTIEIRGGESTTSSIISNTISNSVQITLCSTESSRSFGDASLSVRPEPEGGETEKLDIEKPRTASPPSVKKSAITFSDIANHELLISELQDMRQEHRIRKRQRQPDQEDLASKTRLDSSVDQKSEASFDDQDLDSISTSDWTEVSNDGAEVVYSSCRINLDSSDTDVVNSRERRDSGNSSSNSESPSLCRMSASLPPGLPPLPKSLSGFELRSSGAGPQSQGRPPPPEPPRTGRPQATLDTQLAVLRREMVSDLNLLFIIIYDQYLCNIINL